MNRQSTDNNYEILQITPSASQQEVKQAYRDMAVVWHPDRFSNSPRLQEKAQEAMKRINAAYETLNDPEKRRRYDVFLKQTVNSTYHTQTQSTQNFTEQPRSRKTTYTSRPSEQSQTLEQARAEALKHVQRWVKLVQVVTNVQKQFGIIVPAPNILVQNTEAALNAARYANHRTATELVADTDVKFQLLLSHVNRALEQELGNRNKAIKQAKLTIEQEKTRVSAAINRMQQNYAKEVEVSQRERQTLSNFAVSAGCAASAVMLPIFFINFIAGVAAVISMFSLCYLVQTYRIKQADNLCELARVRAEVRSKLDGQAIAERFSSNMFELEEALRNAEDQKLRVQEAANSLKAL